MYIYMNRYLYKKKQWKHTHMHVEQQKAIEQKKSNKVATCDVY